jgi:hypothetical protein
MVCSLIETDMFEYKKVIILLIYIMKDKDAIELLGLNPDYTKSDLKKAFYRLSLIYHPDKNPRGEEIFKSVNEAYELLSNTSHSNISSDYNDYLTSFLNQFQDVDIMRIITMTEDMSTRLLEKMSDDKLEFVCDFLLKYGRNILSVSDSFIERIKSIREKRITERLTYVIEPSIDDIVKSNIYKLDCLDSSQYVFIPLWHHELEYDDFRVSIHPNLPDNVEIDEENNVIVYLVRELKKVFEDGEIKFDLPFEPIQSSLIKCVQFQTIVLKNKGIPKIFNDIYKNDIKSNLIVRLWMK